MMTKSAFKPFRTAVLLVALSLAYGCASGGASTDESGTTGNRNLITAADVATLPAGDAYDAIERLRPRWLRRRGGGQLAQIRIDGRFAREGFSALRTIQGPRIHEIRFIDSRDATTRFGTGFTGGLIDLTTRGR